MRWYLEISIALFSDTVIPTNLKVFLYINPYGYQISCSSVTQFSRKMLWYLAKIQSCTIVLINNFEILQVSIAFFSDTVRLRTLKFFFYINPYGYSKQTKFHVPRSHSLTTFKNSKLYNCPNKQLWNFTSRHRIFLRYCATEELEIFLVY